MNSRFIVGALIGTWALVVALGLEGPGLTILTGLAVWIAIAENI
jgi:hypothetical protein